MEQGGERKVQHRGKNSRTGKRGTGERRFAEENYRFEGAGLARRKTPRSKD